MSPRAMPAARAISSTGASCMPRSSNSARVTRTSSRSRSRARWGGDGRVAMRTGV